MMVSASAVGAGLVSGQYGDAERHLSPSTPRMMTVVVRRRCWRHRRLTDTPLVPQRLRLGWD